MLEKTVLQQLQEIFPMEVNREEADAGEKIRLRNDEQKVEIDFILDGHLEQGYGYKNFKAYNRDVYETSYISEYGYEEYKKQIQEAINHYNKNEFTLEELADSVKEAEKDNGYSHKDFLVLTNYQEEISSHLFDAVDWQYPDTLFDEWIDGNEINKIGNKYIFTAGMELNDFLKMEYLKDFQQGNVNILGVDGKKYISLEDLVNFDVDRYSEKCLNVVYENEKRESQMQEKIMQFHFNLEFVNKKYKNADVVLKVWATEICREQGLSDYYPVQDVKDAFKTMEYIDEKEAVEIVLNDSEETLIYHKSPEEEYFTREALKHETINFDKESEIEEDLDGLSRDLQSIKEAGVHDMYSIVEMWDDWKEADEHGEPVATFHGAFLDLFAKEKSQSIDKNLISFNSCTFEINLDSKDNGEGCLKWHNYFLTDIHNKDHFYIIQIVQETGKEEPRFSLEKFEKEEGSKLYLGEWVELEDVIKNSSEIEMVQNKLIELSDKEIGIQNEEIKNIEDDFEELDEVEK